MQNKRRFSVAAARFGIAGLVGVGVLLLGACGQKGPLTLPKTASATTAAGSAAVAASTPAR